MNTAGSGGQLDFYTMNTSNVSTDRMTINASGQVGIGTASPAAPLDIAGPCSASACATLNRARQMRGYP